MLKDKHNLDQPKTAKQLVKERTIQVPPVELVRFNEGLYQDKISEANNSVRAKSAKSTGSQLKPAGTKKA